LLTNPLFHYLATTEEHAPVPAMVAICNWLRPGKGEASAAVIARVTELLLWLEEHPEAHNRLSASLRQWLLEAVYFDVLTALGILSRRGFGRELIDRLYERLNPWPADELNIGDAVSLVFHRDDDPDWVSAMPTDTWIQFLAVLWDYDSEQIQDIRKRVCSEMLYAIEMLSIWVAAEELDDEIVRLDPRVVSRDSAFIAQQRELASFIRTYQQWLEGEAEFYDDDHARVLLGQCADALTLLRKRMVEKGSSVALTHLLERLNQTLERIGLLLDILTERDREAFNDSAIELLRQLVRAGSERNSLSVLWRQNSRIVARSITQNASHQGEHYVTSDRREYLSMLRSGAGGGFIIAAMALVKIQVVAQGFTPGLETLFTSLNYGLGFMLIHMVGCTVATKQPAMTAAHFANAVEQEDKGRANATKLADLLVRVSRSQFIAIVGNVSIALALAWALTLGWGRWQGAVLIPADTANYLLHKLDMVHSPALFHAAIAGVWLFVSGLIAGYYDNRAARVGLAVRLAAHPLLTPWLPEGARKRLAAYVDDNYGALIGNFAFGVLLGTTGYLGGLLGLPLDIRHVAFASADLGYAASAVALSGEQLLFYGASVLMIGGINLWVSFSLALAVALRARGIRISSPGKLVGALWKLVRRQPLALVFPPASPVVAERLPPGDGREDGARQKDGDTSEPR